MRAKLNCNYFFIKRNLLLILKMQSCGFVLFLMRICGYCWLCGICGYCWVIHISAHGTIRGQNTTFKTFGCRGSPPPPPQLTSIGYPTVPVQHFCSTERSESKRESTGTVGEEPLLLYQLRWGWGEGGGTLMLQHMGLGCFVACSVYRLNPEPDRIRIRIHGSVPLTNGSRSGGESCSFRQ